MREIKFRAKRVDNGEWAYGSLLIIEDTFYIIKHLDFDYNPHTDATAFWFDCTEQEVNPASVGQFTGLLDKNGMEIYEDDIVHYSDTMGMEFNASIIFQDGIFGFRQKYSRGMSTLHKHETYNDGYCTVKIQITYEVIGNVYDNPELLK